MSVFQCMQCGCIENTALSCQGCDGFAESFFDWSYAPDRQGKKLCSECGPPKYSDGTDTEFGQWHGEFSKRFLPHAEFKTNRVGNLDHIDLGEVDVKSYITDHPVVSDCDHDWTPADKKDKQGGAPRFRMTDGLRKEKRAPLPIRMMCTKCPRHIWMSKVDWDKYVESLGK